MYRAMQKESADKSLTYYFSNDDEDEFEISLFIDWGHVVIKFLAKQHWIDILSKYLQLAESILPIQSLTENWNNLFDLMFISKLLFYQHSN